MMMSSRQPSKPDNRPEHPDLIRSQALPTCNRFRGEKPDERRRM